MEYLKEVKAKIFKSMDVAVNYKEVMNNFDAALWAATISFISDPILNDAQWQFMGISNHA